MRTRYKFSHRDGDYYYWYSVNPLRGDSRWEMWMCHVDWFWDKP